MTANPSDIAGLRDLLAKAPGRPWFYRPDRFDDWGFIRGGELSDLGMLPIVALGREGGVESDHDEHRRNKTDPYGPSAELIVAAVNALPGLLDLIEKLVAERDEAREKNAAYFDEVTACYATIADERQALEAAQAKVGRYEAALKPFARIADKGKEGGRFVIAHAVYEDMRKGVSAPRESYWHWEDFEAARKALAEGGSNG